MADDTARRNPRRAGIMAVAAAALVLLVTGPASAETVTVASVDFRFQPESRTVKVGDVVRWTFAGEPHTVTSGAPGALDSRFDSGIKNPGDSFQVPFETAGTFPYFCEVHPEQMFGTIVVQAAATPAPTARPTVKPTASPTARPTVTAQSSEEPTPAPSTTSTSAPTPEPSVPPTASVTTASSPSAASAISSPSPAPSGSPPVSTPSGPLDVAPILAVAIVVGLLVAGGVAIARRRVG